VIRALIALLLIAAAVAAGAFFAGRPGQVEIVWQGWQIDTSVGVLVAAAALVALGVAGVALLAAALRRAPRNFRRRGVLRRRQAGEAAVTHGLVALAAGDAAEARRHAARATALLADSPSPTALLLAAEAAQRQGDTAAAGEAYTALLARPDAEFLGLRGLIGQALRAGDDAVALPLAARARFLRPGARWLADSLLALQARAGDWVGARETLIQAARRGAMPADEARHRRGVVVHELSRAAEREGDLRRAAGLASRAQALAPDLAEAAGWHARLLLRLGRPRRAAKAIERAWRLAPHPDLAQCYAELTGDAGPVVRAAALQKLAAHNPQAAESGLAIAEAALDAKLWGEARRHLDRAVAAAEAQSAASPRPRLPRRLCLAMARLEEHGSGDLAAARHWLGRAIEALPEPCYVCRRCGAAAARWQSLCTHCGGFATLAWQVPQNGRPDAAVPLPALGAPMMLLPAPELPGGAPAQASPGLAPAAQSDN
jgi:HemY protein